MTIINIRGTSGSGKTYLVREVMARATVACDNMVPILVTGEHPVRGSEIVVGYDYPRAGLTIVGNYGANCGGCDKFSWKGAADWVQQKVAEIAYSGRNVIFEGLMVSSWSFHRFQVMGFTAPVKVFVLSTPLEECLASVRERRLAKGNTDELNPESTTSKYNSILSMGHKHRDAGLDVEFLSRGAALSRCCELLGLPAEIT